MIVGCTGAGKTTLLRRLQRENKEENKQPTETTVGLDIHEDLFEIKDDTLIDFDKNRSQSEKTSNSTNGRQLISMTDFAGQVAYYACHQIYLSRRAFYLVVVDMSKGLEEKAMSYDTDRHSPIGSLFHNWTLADYFVFWLQSIKTYYEDGKPKESRSNETKANPVILIASHRDCIELQKETESSQTSFYDALERCLPSEHTLNDHISPARYYEIECPLGELNEHQEETIEQVRNCIVHTAKSLPHWGEKIPQIWYMFELFVQDHKATRIISRYSLKNEFEMLKENELDDMLRYFSEVGQIIYFSEKVLRNNIILDVGWFVDAFKNIITDPTHARSACSRVKEWDIFMKNGIISDSILVRVWKENEKESYVLEKNKIIPYMEKLGILAKMKTEEVVVKDAELLENRQESLYYIPSINKTDFTTKSFDLYNNGNKTPILVFSFKTFIPHFFFFRLVAICFSKWELLSEDLLCKNIAFYKEKGGDINIAIAVNKTSIQLQAFTPDDKIYLTRVDTKNIRIQIEHLLREITTTLHHQVLYEVGYPCKDINITEKDEHCFLSERTVAELKTNERVCPNFIKEGHEKHQIVRDDLLHYWYTGFDRRAHSSWWLD
ncbi:probable serine/threonine-protein kinase pats1 [Saccostrea cucullata]|uniref:probable serine/threonine-protein kinase pats1 n=1 Tax=Saccostrea cuccullata TaxID=36930 RepID=UPI002ED18684